MASASQHSRNGGWHFHGVARPLVQLATRVHSAWQHHQNEKVLESLPSEIRKDIGWPTSDESDRRLH